MHSVAGTAQPRASPSTENHSQQSTRGGLWTPVLSPVSWTEVLNLRSMNEAHDAQGVGFGHQP